MVLKSPSCLVLHCSIKTKRGTSTYKHTTCRNSLCSCKGSFVQGVTPGSLSFSLHHHLWEEGGSMDVIPVKSETNGTGRRLHGAAVLVPSNGNQVVKVIKRRKREPTLSQIGSDANREMIDQSSTCSTMKRSSRFRGVSRYTRMTPWEHQATTLSSSTT